MRHPESTTRRDLSSRGDRLPGKVCWPYLLISNVLVPLPEPGLENLVHVDPDAPDIALVDLDLMQVCGRMREPLWRAPVVLPEVRAKAVLQRPVDGPCVAVHPNMLMTQYRFPPAQIRRYLALVLVVAGVVVDRRVDRRAIRSACRAVQLPAPLGGCDARVLPPQPVRGVLLAVLVAGNDLQPVLVQVAGLWQLDRLRKHPPTHSHAVHGGARH